MENKAKASEHKAAIQHMELRSRPTAEQIEVLERKLEDARLALAMRPTQERFDKAERDAKDAIFLKNEMARQSARQMSEMQSIRSLLRSKNEDLRYENGKLSSENKELKGEFDALTDYCKQLISQRDHSYGLAKELERSGFETYNENIKLNKKMSELKNTDLISYLQQREKELEDKWTTRVIDLGMFNPARPFNRISTE